MLDYALLVAFILGVWVIQLFAFLGIGLLIGRTITQEKLTVRRALNLTWIGWATCIGFLQLLHLVAPIQVSAQVCIVAAAIIGFFFARSSLSSLLDDFKQQFGTNLGWLLILPMLLTISILAACADWHYDSGNYHQQSVLWATQSSVIPGLGNLHVRLAFNSSLHLYFALLDVGWLTGNAAHLGNSFLVVLCLLSLLFRKPGKDESVCTVNFAAWLVIPGMAALANPLNVATLLTDPAVIVVEVMICFLLVDLFDESNAKEFRETILLVLILSVIGITIKLSVLLFSTMAVLIAGVLLIRRQAHLLKSKSLWTICGSLGLVLAGWIVHGIILSGYPIFPFPFFPLPVQWRVPMQTTVELNGWIKAWPRLVNDCSMNQSYEVILSNWDWVRSWTAAFTRDVWGFKIPLVMMAGGICLVVYLLFGKNGDQLKPGLKACFPVIGMNCLLLVVWFFQAPSLRFVYGLIWVSVALWFGGCLASLPHPKWRKIAFHCVVVVSLALTAKSFHNSLKWLRAHWNPPENVTALVEFKTRTGLILNVPKTGEQCFKAALPCTPYPSPQLSMREKGGFKIEPFSDDAIVGWYTKEMPWEQMKP